MSSSLRTSKPRTVALVAALAGAFAGASAAELLSLTGASDSGQRVTTTVFRPSATAALDAAAVYDGAAPGVVDIASQTTTVTDSGPLSSPQRTQATATGTGFLVGADGHIVTAAHVVDGASAITVTLSDGSSHTAKVLGKDDATDVAVLDIDSGGSRLHPLTLGSSAALGVGDPVAVIGDPFRYARSLSTGVVSALDRTIEAPNGFTVAHAIQTDAALNPGNSGGPLLDARGKVVGIADQIATGGSVEQSAGVGFAVPADIVAAELGALAKGQTVTHAYLGLGMAESADPIGVLVHTVKARGPAAAGGLATGDVITALDSHAIRGVGDLVAAISTRAPGDTIALTVRRGTAVLHVSVTLGKQPASSS